MEEIQHIIKRLKNKKASGIDNIINEYIKKCPLEMSNILVKFFNLVLITGIVPTDWCLGVIKPWYKNKGSADDPENYRGVTFTEKLNWKSLSSLRGNLTCNSS